MLFPGHYPDVLMGMREDLPILIGKYRSTEVRWKFIDGISGTFRGIATIGYLVERDTFAFRSNLIEATTWRHQLFDHFDTGKPVAASLVSMHAYKYLYDALASAEMDVARSFAERLGGRPEVEKKYDRAFEIAMGYSLKAILAGDDAPAMARLDGLELACRHRDYVNFAAYVPVLRAIVTRDSAAAEAAFPSLLAGHRRESKGRGLFRDMEDEFLCVWGVGLLNLACSRGMGVRMDDPLIPTKLIVGSM